MARGSSRSRRTSRDQPSVAASAVRDPSATGQRRAMRRIGREYSQGHALRHNIDLGCYVADPEVAMREAARALTSPVSVQRRPLCWRSMASARLRWSMGGPAGTLLWAGTADSELSAGLGTPLDVWRGERRLARRALAQPRRCGQAASSARVCVKTRVPAASCLGSEYSAGLWLIPLRQGTKIIPVGHTGTTNCASWNAPEG